jgi:hypothetical protein
MVIMKHLDKGGHIDYVRLVQLNKEGIKILPNYYKQIEDLHYSYGSYGGHEIDLVNLSHVICLTVLTGDVKIEDFLLAQEDKNALDNYVKNEQRRQRQKEHKYICINLTTSMSNNYTFVGISIHVANN